MREPVLHFWQLQVGSDTASFPQMTPIEFARERCRLRSVQLGCVGGWNRRLGNSSRLFLLTHESSGQSQMRLTCWIPLLTCSTVKAGLNSNTLMCSGLTNVLSAAKSTVPVPGAQ